MSSIRLIALDLDGTLLDDRKGIPEENLRALHDARRAGIEVAISSGRMLPSIEPIEARAGIDSVIIAYNGGKVVAPRQKGRAVIAHRPVPAGPASAFIDFSRERGYLLNFYCEDRLYAEDGALRRRFMELYRSRTGAEYHVVDLALWKGKAPTKMILLAEPDEHERLLEELRSSHDGAVVLSRSEPEYLEITAPGVHKGAALGALAESLGIAPGEILAVGDADNDNAMLEAAGIGVAVANARETTRSVADYVTERDNNRGAVAEAIRRFALGEG